MATNKDFFKGTMRDIASLSPILGKMVERAIELGAVPERLNLSNAWSKCDKTIRAYQDAEKTISELGYASLPFALKALSQFKQHEIVNIQDLPVVFHKVPGIWISGKPKTKLDKGFAPLRPRDAERQHKSVLPWILEVWQLSENAENCEEIRATLQKDYLTMHHEEFARACYVFINDLEIPELEEEFTDLVSSPSVAQLMNTLGKVENVDYGVGGDLA
jgi:hypothetical protein